VCESLEKLCAACARVSLSRTEPCGTRVPHIARRAIGHVHDSAALRQADQHRRGANHLVIGMGGNNDDVGLGSAAREERKVRGRVHRQSRGTRNPAANDAPVRESALSIIAGN
jgi:hypothetical protein